MDNFKEKFLRTYANIPLNLRNDIALVLEDGRPITWDVAFFEVKNDTESSKKILLGLEELGLI